jgi:carbamoyltransferase
MNILGLNAFHGDASAALLTDGILVAAVEEERINRIKHWAGLPLRAAELCLAGTSARDLQHVAISRDPSANMWRKVLRVATSPGSWNHARQRAANGLRVAHVREELARSLPVGRAQMHNVEHHRAHLASAFFASPFEEAAVASIDGFGDFTSAMWGTGTGNRIDVDGAVRFPHSLGLFYTAFTQLLGFTNFGDEYKVMGLAAYGEPRLTRQVRKVISNHDGIFRLNLDYFVHHTDGVAMTWDGGQPVIGSVYSSRMASEFGGPRTPRSEILPIHADLAASVQVVFEEQYFALLNRLYRATGKKALCLAGGCALNCAANGKIFEKTPFQDLYVQPASNDSGTAIGAALHVWHQELRQPRSFVMSHAYYGPEHDNDGISLDIEAVGAIAHRLSEHALVDCAAEQIAAGMVLGWFQGRMEFGPRALGNRSILADPRRADMKDVLNMRIKHREHFRPFCPSILAERTADYFETGYPAPFMVSAYRIRPEKQAEIAAVTHADGTGRLQTVERDQNPLYWKLLSRFEYLTGVPILLNTSFNENEPVVNTPAEALDCFLRTNMDVLCLGPFVLFKTENLHATGNRRSFAEQAPSGRA